jgi:hypothetical protein
MCVSTSSPEDEFIGFLVLSVFKHLRYRDNEKYFIIAATDVFDIFFVSYRGILELVL